MQDKSTPKAPETTDAPDITLDTAAANRLLALLLAREAGRPDAQQNLRELAEETSTPSDRLSTLLFFASLRFSLKGKPRATERMSAILKGPRATPETRADVGRAERVWKLLDRLVRTGCLRRGEA